MQKEHMEQECAHLACKSRCTCAAAVVQVNAAIQNDENAVNVAPWLEEYIALLDMNSVRARKQQAHGKGWKLIQERNWRR